MQVQQSNRTQRFQVKSLFGMPDAPEEMEILGMPDNPNCDAIPKITPYTFHKDGGFRDINAFLSRPNHDGLYITGLPGCGKTTLALQFAARVNWPVQSIACHGRFEFMDAVGQFELIKGETRFVYGPLAIAMKEGHILLINEIDRAEPSETIGFNDVLEGKPLVITQNGGEVIYPHPDFRMIVTGNTAGSGDSTGLHQGALIQDLAFMDRFRVIHMQYPAEDVEKQILHQAQPDLNAEILNKMVDFANLIRKRFSGEDAKSAARLSVTMSTRTLVRWAHLAMSFRGAPNALEYSLKQALSNRAKPADQVAILQLASDTFGSHWAR